MFLDGCLTDYDDSLSSEGYIDPMGSPIVGQYCLPSHGKSIRHRQASTKCGKSTPLDELKKALLHKTFSGDL